MSPTPNIDEQQLVTRIVSFIHDGDRKSAAASFAVLVKRYSPQVFGFISRMVDSQDDVKDLAQNTFIKAFNNLSKFEGRATFFTWVCRIAYNESVNLLKSRRQTFVSIDDTDIPDDDPDDDFSTGDEKRISQLEAAIDLLPPDDQMLIHLYYYEDKTFKEIAFIIDADDNTLRVRLHRIRRKLAGMVTKAAH